MFRPRSPPGNLCQKVHLLIQCALSSISPLKKGKGPETALQIGAGCLQSHRAGARVFLRASQTSGLKMPQHEARCTQASDVLYSSPTRLGERGVLFFFPSEKKLGAPRATQATALSPFCCHRGTANKGGGQHCFRSCSASGGKKISGVGGGEEQRGETSET